MFTDDLASESYGKTAAAALEHRLRSVDRLPGLRAAEGYLAPVSDPGLVVHWRTPKAMYRLHPGGFDDPIGSLDAIAMLEPLDDSFLSTLGFGITDVVDLALVGMDAQLQCLAPAWASAARTSPDARVAIADNEVHAAIKLLDGGSADLRVAPAWLAQCRHPDRCDRLLAAMAVPVDDGGPPSFVLRLAGRPVFAPAGFMIPTLSDTVSALVGYICDVADIDEVLLRVTRVELARLLLRHPIGVECADPDNDPFIAHIGARHAIRFELEGSSVLVDPASEAVPVVVTTFAETPYVATEPPTVAIGELSRLVRRSSWPDLVDFFQALGAPGRLPLARSIVDLYELWTHARSLNGEVGNDPVPIAVDGGWDKAAAWEPVDRILVDLAMPPSREWATRKLDNEVDIEATLTIDAPPRVVLMRVEPSFAVLIEISSDCPDLRLLMSLADAMRLRAMSPPILDLIAAVGAGRAVLLHLDVVEDLEPGRDEGPDELMGVGVAGMPATSTTPATLSVLFDERVVMAHATDPESAHRAIGAALLAAAERCAELDPALPATFLAAWSAQPPLLMASAHNTVGAAIPLRAPLLQRRPEIGAGVGGQAAAAAGVRHGILGGAEAIDFVTSILCPALIADARKRISQFDKDELLRFSVFQLEQTIHWREQADHARLLAYHAPWTPEQADLNVSQEPAGAVRAVELLIELIATTPTSGDSTADHLDWIDIVSLADAALHAAIAADTARLGLTNMAALIRPGLAAVDAGEPVAVDLTSFQTMRTAHHLRPGRWDPQEETRRALEHGEGTEKFRSFTDANLPPIWRDIDQAIHESTGADLDAINAVLGTAASWPVTATEPAAVVDRRILIAEAAEWSSCDPARVGAAIDLLTFDGERVREVPPDYWRIEQRKARLATRPLVKDSSARLWIMPNRIRMTQHLLVQYLADGRLPWPDLPTATYEPMWRLRSSIDKEHEDRVISICRDLGLKFWQRLKPKKARARGLDWPDALGEFDVLAADPQRDRLWILEAKNAVNAVSAWHLQDAVSDFHEPDGHLDKLQRRIHAVEANPATTGTLLGLEPRPWSVHAAMVTVQVEIAAFTLHPRVTFVVVDDLADLLTSSGPFTPGHWSIGVA
jgi:hypothetical protein